MSDICMGQNEAQKSCGQGQSEELYRLKEQLELQEALFGISNKIVVLSGKGGVGKSSVATNLAVALSLAGKKTGLLDVDLHGPSIPTLLGLEGRFPAQNNGQIEPVDYNDSLKVMSVGLLLRNQTDALIWRGPAKHGMIKQFLANVAWGALDYLIVDCPPGTGDEPLSVIQLLDGANGAIIVTTPQDVALNDVRKSVTFCAQLKLPVIGVVENMSGFVCPHCCKEVDIFKRGGGKTMADEMAVPFLGGIPLDPAMVSAGDAGEPLVANQAASPTSEAIGAIVSAVTSWCDSDQGGRR